MITGLGYIINIKLKENIKEELKSWYQPLIDWEVLTDRTKDNIDIIYENGIILPSRENVFRAFRECEFDNCRVVMIFQDPYPTIGLANGIATATDNNKIPETLKNMFIELKKEYGFVMKYGYRFANVEPNLLNWCKQGVLMLNAALTVELGEPGSHLNMWSKWTKRFITELDKNKKVIWVLFGKEIQKYENLIMSNNIIKVVHPVAESYKNNAGFFGSNVFKDINNRLHNKIEWYE